MRVLLDENLPHRLRVALPGHEVFTADYMGWAGIQNGSLLRLVEAGGFEVFVTADRKMRGQQNLVGRPFAVVYLTAQEWPMLSARVAEILAAIDAAVPGSVQVVECGEFRR
jgi:predicted nuclease of predicted toxin-antitoxin system